MIIREDSVLSVEPLAEEMAQDVSVRPKCFADYLGQTQVKEQMGIFIAAAKSRSEALDHVLTYGPPGLGKTTIANIIANELGVGFKQTSGPVLEKAGDLAAILTNLAPRDVLFIDEIHRMNPAIEEILYPAMEDFQLDIMIGEGPAARSVKLELAPFTLVGATTRAGLLSSPLRDRFGITARLQFYAVEELKAIVIRSASILNVTGIDEGGAREIAFRSRGTPRIANRLLRRVRDFAEVKGDGCITETLARHALDLLQVDQRGLDETDRRYLRFMIDRFDGGPVGIDSLAAALGDERGTIEDVVEPYLVQQGFVVRSARGRLASELAYAHFGMPTSNKVTLDKTVSDKVVAGGAMAGVCEE